MKKLSLNFVLILLFFTLSTMELIAQIAIPHTQGGPICGVDFRPVNMEIRMSEYLNRLISSFSCTIEGCPGEEGEISIWVDGYLVKNEQVTAGDTFWCWIGLPESCWGTTSLVECETTGKNNISVRDGCIVVIQGYNCPKFPF